jgi:hypothetical protein
MPFSFAGGTPAYCIANNKRLSHVTVNTVNKSGQYG